MIQNIRNDLKILLFLSLKQNKMKRFFYALIGLLLIACGKDTNTFTLKGTAYGYEDGTNIFLYGLDENNQPEVMDTLTVKDQKFEGDYAKLETAALNFLKVENTSNNIIFFAESENINAQIYSDSLAASRITGGRQNDLYNEYMSKVKDITLRKRSISEQFQIARNQQDQAQLEELRNQNIALTLEEKTFKKNFVQDNSNSLFSLMLLSELFKSKEFSSEETTKILDSLNPKLASSPVVTELRKTIENAKKADIGGLAPNFEAPTPTGEMLSLKETLGKYTIIDFWASWCRPCRIENPNVVKVYEKYHDKGLNIISVSLDRNGQKDRWIKAIEDDNMDWYHVSNLQFWQDPIARQYNVRSIPATFLLDKDGRIIDKNLRGQALERRISQLLD